jgi:hypothetical protein
MRRGLGLRRRDPATALTYQVCAIIEGRKQLAGYRDERTEAVAAEWGRVLADAIRLSAAPASGIVSPKIHNSTS